MGALGVVWSLHLEYMYRRKATQRHITQNVHQFQSHKHQHIHHHREPLGNRDATYFLLHGCKAAAAAIADVVASVAAALAVAAAIVSGAAVYAAGVVVSVCVCVQCGCGRGGFV